MCEVNAQIKTMPAVTGLVAAFTAQTIWSLNTWCMLKVLTKSSTSPASSGPVVSSFALSLGARNYEQKVSHDNRMIVFVFLTKRTDKHRKALRHRSSASAPLSLNMRASFEGQ